MIRLQIKAKQLRQQKVPVQLSLIRAQQLLLPAQSLEQASQAATPPQLANNHSLRG